MNHYNAQFSRIFKNIHLKVVLLQTNHIIPAEVEKFASPPDAQQGAVYAAVPSKSRRALN